MQPRNIRTFEKQNQCPPDNIDWFRFALLELPATDL